MIAQETLMLGARTIGMAMLVGLWPVTAQAEAAPIPAKVSDQIRCELNADCPENAGNTESDQRAPSRSWSWGRAGTVSPSRSETARLQRAPVAGLAATGTSRSRASAAQQKQGASRRSRGRSNLMISFLPGSSSLTADGRVDADNVLAALSAPEMTNRHFLVVGHTKVAGDPEMNRDLSRRRAQALVDYLVAKGMDRAVFRVRGYGGDRPLAGVSPYSGLNRRVEIISLD
jgi:outer membrane protein OmpA-like peptidoglycan-associated protein